MATVGERAAKLNERLTHGNIGHSLAVNVTGKDLARVVQFFRRFGQNRFNLDNIFAVTLDDDLIQQYEITGSKRQDDLTVMTKRLPVFGILNHYDGSMSFELTNDGALRAQREIDVRIGM